MSRLRYLEKRLAGAPQESTERVDLMNMLIYELATPDFKQAEKLARKSAELSRKLNYRKGLIYAEFNTGLMAMFKNNPEPARTQFEKVLPKFEKLGDAGGQADTLFFLGLIHWSYGDIEKGFECNNRALQFYRDSEHEYGVAWSLNMLAGYYYDMEDYEESLQNFQDAYTIFDKIETDEGRARALNGIGNNHLMLGDAKKALEFQNRALKVTERCKNLQVESRVLHDLGSIHEHLNHEDEALDFYLRSLKLRQEIKYTTAEITTLIELGKLYLKHRQLEDAKSVLDKALKLAQQLKARPKECRAHQHLSQLHELQGDAAKALQHYRRFHELEVEVYHETANKKLKHRQAIHNLEATRKEAEIYRLKNVELKEKNEQLKQLFNDLKSTETQLIQAEKMAALGKLVAGIAHEFNNPIAAVSSSNSVNSKCADTVESAIADTETIAQLRKSSEVQRALRILKSNGSIIRQATERMQEFVRSLRNFARLDSAQFQEADIHQGLESTLVLLAGSFPSEVTVRKEYGKIPPIRCHAGELNQVFMSLLNNAIKATTQGEITIRTHSNGDQVHVEIVDTGHGIPPEKLKTIFDFDFSSHGPRVKMSSGLAIANQIIQAHDGAIHVTSEPGKGSVFTVTLPLQPKRQAGTNGKKTA